MIIPRNGDRIRLVGTDDDPNPIPVGEMGTVVSVNAQAERDRIVTREL